MIGVVARMHKNEDRQYESTCYGSYGRIVSLLQILMTLSLDVIVIIYQLS
jgi:hypothetical protein